MALGYLLDPFIQINNINGTPIVGAKIYVYNADTTNLATTYNDFEGHLNTNPVITDDLGNATIIADDGIEYDISVHDENDLLLFTKKYISIDKTSSAGGTTQVAPGYGVTVERVGNTFVVSIDTDLIATKDDLDDKQDKLHAGDNIEITDDNTVNVVGRSELVVQEPLRLTREQNKLKLYVDNNIETLYKTVQTPAAYGGNVGNYISRIQQNPNGEITCEVSDLSDIAAYQAGDNITIVGHTINGRDWTPELNQKVDKTVYNAYVAEHLDDDNTPYTAGSNINITNHVVSGKDWTSTINNAPTTNGWDVTPYVAGSNIAIGNHTINGKDWTSTIQNAPTTYSWDVTPYTAGGNIYISNHTIAGRDWTSTINSAPTLNNWDVTPYTAGSNITISNHQISCNGDVTPYTAGNGISINNHTISCTGDITPYTAGNGISINNHRISCNGDITPYTAGTNVTISNHVISVKPYKMGIDIDPGEGASLYNNSTQPGVQDKFMIYISREAGASHSKITVYNFNTSRTLYAFVNGTQVTSIPSSSDAVVNTFTSYYNLITLELVGMGVGEELPYYKFTIVAQDTADYGTVATLYELYRYVI